MKRILAMITAFCIAVLSGCAGGGAPGAALSGPEKVIQDLGIGGTVSADDDKMGMHLTSVSLDEDGDIYIQWDFDNEKMASNLTYAWSRITLVDPDDIHHTYQAFTRGEDNTISMSFKAGDVINHMNYLHIIRTDFETGSGMYLLYFDGSGDDAPEELTTVPEVFLIIEDEDGPRAYETTPRYASEFLIDAVRSQDGASGAGSDPAPERATEEAREDAAEQTREDAAEGAAEGETDTETEEGPVPIDKAVIFKNSNTLTASATGQSCHEQYTYCKNWVTYQQAAALLASAPDDPETIQAALEMFRSAGDVLDTPAQIKECENSLSYLAACALFKDKKWSAAEEAFTPLANENYRDSKDYKTHCAAHITYNKAEDLFKKKSYYDAYLLYNSIKDKKYDDLPNMAEKAKACIQKQPADGEVYHNPKYNNNTTQLTIDNSGYMNTFVKLYIGKDLVSTVFIKKDNKATIWLPAGTYKMNKAYGETWFGTEDLFGDDGYYWTCTFAGSETFTLQSGNGYLISSGDEQDGTRINDKATSRKSL